MYNPHRLDLCLMIILVIVVISTSQAFSWTKTLDFEEGLLATEAQGPSGFDDAFSLTLFSNERANTGTKSAKISWLQGSDGWAQSGGQIIFPTPLVQNNELWMRVYSFFPSNFNFTANPRLKFIRAAHIKKVNGIHLGYLDLYIRPDRGVKWDNEIAVTTTDIPGVTVNTDVWEGWEIYIKFSVTTPIVRIWKNGVLIFTDTTTKTFNDQTDIADFSYIFTYWNGGVPQNQHNYVDDISLTNEIPIRRDSQGNPMIGPIPASLSGLFSPSPDGVTNNQDNSSGGGCGFIQDKSLLSKKSKNYGQALLDTTTLLMPLILIRILKIIKWKSSGVSFSFAEAVATIAGANQLYSQTEDGADG